ncbi:MAG: glycogen/starch/alpha-glucan phosphorylase [Acidobacteriota bacterium]
MRVAGSSSFLVTPDSVRGSFLHYLRFQRGVEFERSSRLDHLTSLCLAVRETLVNRRLATQRAWRRAQPKIVNYLSMEYMIGRLLRNNLIATELLEPAQEALASLGLSLDELLDAEDDAGLGNGGLGRLAACFLDSMATLDLPAYGYGLRYDYGIFRQKIRDGWQEEVPDTWLKNGYPWEIHRPDLTVQVYMGGHVDWGVSPNGEHQPGWVPARHLFGVPYDVLIPGFGTESVIVLRLWRAEAPEEFDFEIFSRGDYLRAVEQRERAAAITRVLYPPDDTEAGRELRLMQEYFLVACTVRDVINRFERHRDGDWSSFPAKVAFQLNDTHPALTVAELMRFFVDEAGLPWARAWEITTVVCNYTNHTLLPEALETWPAEQMQRLLPRHVQVIHEINRRFLDEVRLRAPGEAERIGRMSIFQDNGDYRFRMANLAMAGSRRVNGVARLHTDLLRRHLARDFAELWPEKFVSITNGITPRRWLMACNPALAEAITRRLGDTWPRDLDRLAELRALADDPDFQEEVLAIKRANKVALASTIRELTGVEVDPSSLFDVQIKRLHEYKRQLLNALHIIALYNRLHADSTAELTPRTFIFAAKAAPAYHMAKRVIRLINAIADTVNNDPVVDGRLKVVFLPDYRVTLAERIIPAADLSEQISTAGMEASGTGNMKLALNGALTIGTLDGATIEMLEAIGADNMFIFGLTAEEVAELRASGRYNPWAYYEADPDLRGALDVLHRGALLGGDPGVLHDLWASLMHHGDRYLVLADFRPYLEAQRRAAALYRDRRAWAAAAIRNIAGMGRFSSDRSIREYATLVWDLPAVPVNGTR